MNMNIIGFTPVLRSNWKLNQNKFPMFSTKQKKITNSNDKIVKIARLNYVTSGRAKHREACSGFFLFSDNVIQIAISNLYFRESFHEKNSLISSTGQLVKAQKRSEMLILVLQYWYSIHSLNNYLNTIFLWNIKLKLKEEEILQYY